MQVFRRRRLQLALGWLVLQFGILMFTPAALCLGVLSAADAECTCAHGDAQQCPMHQQTTTPKSTCSCRSTTDTTSANLAAMLGPSAVLPAVIEVSLAPISRDALTSIAAPLINAPSVPEAPPPRA